MNELISWKSLMYYRNERCTMQETFRNSGTNAAQCRKHSGTSERTLHNAGNIPERRNERCTMQETFRNVGTNAARCRKHSGASERTLHDAGNIPERRNERCTMQETFRNVGMDTVQYEIFYLLNIKLL
ncbi:MAG: hypothetical protein LBG15_14015 [Dysgonamonadaceae bacterium]|jgi:hypothetical protein|nr:hypothetical protein [Dysgonamonadaceae bacterium]